MDMHLEAGIFVRKNPNIAIAKAISVAMGTVSAARLCVHVCVRGRDCVREFGFVGNSVCTHIHTAGATTITHTDWRTFHHP